MNILKPSPGSRGAEGDIARSACTPFRPMTHIILLNTRIPTRLALRTDLAALARSRTLSLLNLTEGIESR